MHEHQWLAEGFEENRTHLKAVAYRMLGSLAEADDAVQEAWLRLSRAEASRIENLGGWLTTLVARVCLNMLHSRTSRREEPLEGHVPDPIVSSEDGIDPEQEALLADSVGLALLVVLETLTPAERLAFVLHDMFDVPFDEIAPIVERSPATARQLASRARRRVKGAAPAPDVDLVRQREVVDAFLAVQRRVQGRSQVLGQASLDRPAPTQLEDPLRPRGLRGDDVVTVHAQERETSSQGGPLFPSTKNCPSAIPWARTAACIARSAPS